MGVGFLLGVLNFTTGKKKMRVGECPDGLVVRNCCFHCRGPGV